MTGRRILNSRAMTRLGAVLAALTVLVVWVASRRAGEGRDDRRWLLGSLGLASWSGPLLAVVVTSALPTAQNVYVAAVRYRSAEAVTRDVVLVTSVAAMGTMAVVALLLA